MKRLIDLVVSGLLLVPLLPVMLITAAVVKATSPGPALFPVEDPSGPATTGRAMR